MQIGKRIAHARRVVERLIARGHLRVWHVGRVVRKRDWRAMVPGKLHHLADRRLRRAMERLAALEARK